MITTGMDLQDSFLEKLQKQKISVSVYLTNGIKLQGQVTAFDQYVLFLRNTVTQMVYKHAVSTVVPAQEVAMTDDDTGNRVSEY